MEGGEPSKIQGLAEGEFPWEWHNGSPSIFVERHSGLNSIDLYDLNLATGEQKPSVRPTRKVYRVWMYRRKNRLYPRLGRTETIQHRTMSSRR